MFFSAATGEFFSFSKECVRCVLNTTVIELLKNPNRRFIFIEMAFFSRYWNEIDNKTRQQIRKLIDRSEYINYNTMPSASVRVHEACTKRRNGYSQAGRQADRQAGR